MRFYLGIHLFDNREHDCSLNKKLLTIEPGFHRQGLGEIILDQIAKRYPDSIGMELYTRKANYSAQIFYKHSGFQVASNFEFGKPLLTLNNMPTLYFPDDEIANSPDAFVAYYKSDHSYRF